MVLCFESRPATRDVDAVYDNDKEFVRAASRQIAAEKGFPDDWLNDGVKGFLSSKDGGRLLKNVYKEFPSSDEVGLRVYTPTPEYLLAMKCMSMRTEAGSKDIEDIQFLIKHLGIKKSEAVFALISEYYPNKQVQAKTQFGIEEIMDQLDSDGYGR